MQQPKILVGCPTSDHKKYCIEEYAKAIKNLSYPNYDILLVDNSQTETYSKKLQTLEIPIKRDKYLERARDRIVHSRNVLRKYALENGYDYFLSLEQDVIPPKNVIEQLLQHKKEVITGIYYMEYAVKKEGKTVGKKILPLLYKKKDDKNLQQLQPQEVEKEECKPITASGLGCILIKREILEQIKFRYEKDKLVFDDIWFCQDLEKKGIPLYVNTAVKCKHLMREMDWNSIEK